MIISLIIGLSLIGFGFLAKSNPYILFMSMPAERVRNIDVESVGSLYKKGMIAIGLITIFFSGLFTLLKLYDYVLVASLAPMLVGIVVLIILAQKYDHYKGSKFKKLAPIIFAATLMSVVIVLFCSMLKNTEVIVSKDEVKFTGEYGITIYTQYIDVVELWTELPKIEKRIKGITYGNSIKGDFTLEGVGDCTLFVIKNNPPYIHLVLDSGKQFVYSMSEPKLTQDIYSQIKNVAKPHSAAVPGSYSKDKIVNVAPDSSALKNTTAVVSKDKGAAVAPNNKLLKNCEIVFLKDKIKFTGKYGTTILASQINSLELWTELPEIEKCINGVVGDKSIEGDFTIKYNGDCRLFVNINNPLYIYIQTNSGKKIIYNTADRMPTHKLYFKLADAMEEY